MVLLPTPRKATHVNRQNLGDLFLLLLFHVISLGSGTSFDKPVREKKKKEMRRQTSECLKDPHLPFQIYTIHVFGWNFVIFKNYLRLYFMQNTQVLCSLQSTSKSLETLNVYTDRL